MALLNYSNVIEILPEDIDSVKGIVAPDLAKGILIIMISNPETCTYCVEAEPKFHAASSKTQGLAVKFAIIHLNLPEWRNLSISNMKTRLQHITTEFVGTPEYAVIIDGQRTTWKPINRNASSIYSLVNVLYQTYITNGYEAYRKNSKRGVQKRRYRSGRKYEDYDEYDDDAESNDADLFESMMIMLDQDSIYGYDASMLRAIEPGHRNPTYETDVNTSYNFC